MGPTPVEGVGDIAMFSDPDGNAIGLLTMSEGAP
jgi:predicted enzyme related to lactoylglutathione lyase